MASIRHPSIIINLIFCCWNQVSSIYMHLLEWIIICGNTLGWDGVYCLRRWHKAELPRTHKPGEVMVGFQTEPQKGHINRHFATSVGLWKPSVGLWKAKTGSCRGNLCGSGTTKVIFKASPRMMLEMGFWFDFKGQVQSVEDKCLFEDFVSYIAQS